MTAKTEISAFALIKDLPLSFKAITAVPQQPSNRRSLFVYVTAFQGLSLVESNDKPISKIINWQNLDYNGR